MSTAEANSAFKSWLHAFRLRTLPLAISSILVGSAAAHFFGSFSAQVFIAACITAILLQVLSNLANDLGDHLHGTDNDERVGPQRAVQGGHITAASMRRAMWICGILAFASGLWLILSAAGLSLITFVFLLLGIAAIAAAVKYTYGDSPYGYAGLGDVFVLLFFGAVGVGGIYFLQTHFWRPVILLPAFAFGLFSAAVLNTNNMRDINGDEANGKITMAVRLGFAKAKSYHAALIILGLLALVLFTILNYHSTAQWGFLIAAPAFGNHLRNVLGEQDPAALDTELKRMALSTFLCAVLFSVGLFLS